MKQQSTYLFTIIFIVKENAAARSSLLRRRPHGQESHQVWRPHVNPLSRRCPRPIRPLPLMCPTEALCTRRELVSPRRDARRLEEVRVHPSQVPRERRKRHVDWLWAGRGTAPALKHK